MNIPAVSKRLEITFWIVAVKLMKDGKMLRTVPVFVSVGLCLTTMVLTILFSILFGILSGEKATTHEPPVPEMVVSGNATNLQHNTLVILVDQLVKEPPQLEGVWLVAQFPMSPRLTFIPLYPTSSMGGSDQDELLDNLFDINIDGDPSFAFLEALREMDLWWDDFLMLDRVSLARLVEQSGGVDLGMGFVGGAMAITQLPLAREEPHAALIGQAKLASGLCMKLVIKTNEAITENLFASFSNGFYTNINLKEVHLGWNHLEEGGNGLTCEFPTLKEISLINSGY